MKQHKKLHKVLKPASVTDINIILFSGVIPFYFEALHQKTPPLSNGRQLCWVEQSWTTKRAVKVIATCGASLQLWQGSPFLDCYASWKREPNCKNI